MPSRVGSPPRPGGGSRGNEEFRKSVLLLLNHSHCYLAIISMVTASQRGDESVQNECEIDGTDRCMRMVAR